MSTLKTGALRGTSGTADSIQLHASNQSVTFPGNVTCSGTATGFGGGKILQIVRNYNAGPVTSTNTDWTDLFSSDLSITVSSNSNPIILYMTLQNRLEHSSNTAGDMESSYRLKCTTSGETSDSLGTRPATRIKNAWNTRDSVVGMWFYTGYTATTQTFMWQQEKGSHPTSLEGRWIHSLLVEVAA